MTLDSSGQLALQLRQVRLQLPSADGQLTILDNVSLDIMRGETVALVGPSGSGKTSLLMVSAGLEPATTGEVCVAGRRLDTMKEDELARFRRDHIGIVFQAFHLMPTMTALENVALPLELSGERNPWNRAKEALEAVGLAHRLTHYPSQLSGGEQQRAALARAIVMRPAVLMADEPTGNLDRETGHQIFELLFSLQKAYGATLLMITHDGELAARCARTVSMQDGRIRDIRAAA